MADAPAPISSSPSMPPAPYDACSDAPVGQWEKISANPPHGSEDLFRTEYPDSGPWRQT